MISWSSRPLNEAVNETYDRIQLVPGVNCVLHYFVHTRCPELNETIPPGIVIMGVGGGNPTELS